MRVCFDIPDGVAPRLIDAIALQHGWDPNGTLTKAQFLRKYVMDTLLSGVVQAEGDAAGNVARVAAEKKARDEIVLS